MIYFDNSSTTKVGKPAIKKILYTMTEEYANPSSLHSLGFSAEKELLEARKIISKIINADEKEIFFTSGGTEANNLAVFGTFLANKKTDAHFITGKTEHPSVIEAFKRLEKNGKSVSYIDVDKNGYIDLEQLENSITDKTALVSVMHINNEVGTINDIEKIYKIIKMKNKKTLFHTDCVQSFCKHNINSKYADLISLSAHKIHGPKGSGALFIKKGVRTEPVFVGGKQQNSVRPGTENVPGIAGFAAAAENMYKNISENCQKALSVKNKLSEIRKLLPDIYINGDLKNGSPYILNISFKDVKGEVLLHCLEDKKIYVSTGSACSSGHKKYKGTVSIIGGIEESALRFSFSAENTVEEAEECIKALLTIVPSLREYRQL